MLVTIAKMTVTRSAELKKSKQIATRSTTNGNTHFGQLPYQKKHKNQRQPKPIPKPIAIPIPIIPIPIPIPKDDDEAGDNDGENSIVSEYSIIPVRERLYFSEEEEEDEEEGIIIEDDIIYGPDKYSVSVDFDEAQSEWEANKKRLVNGSYVYLCGKVTNGGKNKCRRGCKDGIGLYSGCAIHFMWEEIQHHQ